jgi:PKD repeat protein
MPMPTVPRLGLLGRREEGRRRSLGQSLVELALILPVLLLFLLNAIDYGRVYLGYVNLQQTARLAAGFAAEHASAWQIAPPDPTTKDRWLKQIEADADVSNCTLLPVPDPAFPDGYDLGDPVQVKIDCNFTLMTPVISSILGNPLLVSAEVVYPIREGAVAEVPGGGGPIAVPPNADFFATPRSGYEPLDVSFTDDSTGSPTSWLWNFGNGSNSSAHTPSPVTYSCDASVLPGDSCPFTVSLRVGNTSGFDTETKSAYITVKVPPLTGPIAEFEGTPLSGVKPLTVNFDFIDIRATQGTPVVYTDFAWDFGDGSGVQSGAAMTSVSHTYANEGTYSVTLTVTDDAAKQDSLTKTDYVIVSHKICVVPDFAGTRKNGAQSRWTAAGFTTTVQFLPGTGNYLINYQSQLGGLSDPVPDGCDSPLTVGP